MTGSSIFVFGSNLAGRHGKGAALAARREYGAEYGVGEGRTGNAYAIPTKGHGLEVLPLASIERSVKQFLAYAAKHEDLKFLVTRVGCGLAGYKDHQIAPFFQDATSNVQLPDEWLDYYANRSPATISGSVGGNQMSNNFVVHKMRAPFDVYIGRGLDSIFGNPFTHQNGTAAKIVVGSREEAVQAFRDWITGKAYQDVEPERRQAIRDALPSLKGKVLGCWCAPLACHGDVLAELANGDALLTVPETVVEQPQPANTRPKMPIVPPGNIFSGEKSPRTVLTNPTELAKRKGNLRHSYPVTIDGVTYPDAEEAYQRLKWDLAVNDEGNRQDLCTLVITAKLRQHPMLVDFITANGGVAWLAQCTHFVNARTSDFSEWEGAGYDSAFIRCLIKAYRATR